MICKREIDLDTITFIGGSAQTFDFAVYNTDGRAIDLSNHTCKFYLSRYDSVPTTLVLEKDGYISEMEPHNQFSVDLSTADTKNLSGKYVYQISLNFDDETYEVGQGFCVIVRNINR